MLTSRPVLGAAVRLSVAEGLLPSQPAWALVAHSSVSSLYHSSMAFLLRRGDACLPGLSVPEDIIQQAGWIREAGTTLRGLKEPSLQGPCPGQLQPNLSAGDPGLDVAGWQPGKLTRFAEPAFPPLPPSVTS